MAAAGIGEGLRDLAVNQAKGAVFRAEVVPAAGAATGWPDMRAAYDALDDETRDRVGTMAAYHSLYYSQARAGCLPSKRTDEGGYSGYGYHDKEPSLRPLVHYHHWEVGDIAVWDNRRLMHRATPFDLTQPRRMWHTASPAIRTRSSPSTTAEPDARPRTPPAAPESAKRPSPTPVSR